MPTTVPRRRPAPRPGARTWVPSAARRPPQALPAWPLYLVFAGFPLWWVAGLGSFAVALCAAPMLVLMFQRGRTQLPPAFGLWLAFLLWSATCVIEIDDLSRLVGFVFRLANYAGATVLFLYVFNAREQLTPRRVAAVLSIFFAVVVAGGYLGVLAPNGSFRTLTESVLPSSIAQNDYVQALVHPAFAEVQTPYGSYRTFSRPSAPFPYTNSWGCNTALLVPFVVASALTARTRRVRLALVALLVAALVPAFATLNRGMFLAIGMLLAYTAARQALRGRLGPLVAIVVSGTAGLGLAFATGAVAALTERLRYSQSNTSRSTIYGQAFDGAVQSPLFGNGAPRPSNLLNISVGTQGQVWNVMFSYGFVGLAFFLTFFATVAFASRRAADPVALWIHAAVVVAFATFFYYGYDGPQLAVLMVACALALRRTQDAKHVQAAVAPVALGRRGR